MTEEQAQLGVRVKTNRDFFDLPAGATGEIIEDYGTGIQIQWDKYDFKDGFNKRDELIFLDLI